MNFKVGDVVVCINGKAGILQGHNYIIRSIGHGICGYCNGQECGNLMVDLVDVWSLGGLCSSRFILYKKQKTTHLPDFL